MSACAITIGARNSIAPPIFGLSKTRQGGDARKPNGQNGDSMSMIKSPRQVGMMDFVKANGGREYKKQFTVTFHVDRLSYQPTGETFFLYCGGVNVPGLEPGESLGRRIDIPLSVFMDMLAKLSPAQRATSLL